jgi:hypothetical protein
MGKIEPAKVNDALVERAIALGVVSQSLAQFEQ